MRDEGVAAAERLAELRASFDLGFSRPIATAKRQTIRFLAIRAGTDPFLVRLDQIDSIERTRHLVALPAAPTALLGVMGIRGSLCPVYSLARLAGYDGGGSEDWVLFCGRGALGLAIAAFDGYREVAPDALATGADARRYVSGLARVSGMAMGIVDIVSVLEDVRRGNGVAPPRSND
jgi:chemotaxis signal transduction protein